MDRPGKTAARTLMFQGTGSDVGKSLLVAGLCRAFARRGLTVRPFKPQNMSNNAAVTADGGEIGRAQALQARACGVEPTIHMNPVLLKPQTDVGAQVVVCGQVLGNAGARDYHALKPSLLPRVLESFAHMRDEADLVLIEGAGSAAEVNLRDSDIANMGFAEAADVPVMLIGDIDRGGVIASIVGTHALISESERARLAGYVINKFRGDPTLFDPALTLIREKTGLDSFGVIPFFPQAGLLPKEDAMALDNDRRASNDAGAAIRMAVPRLSRIANFDDLDPLLAEADVSVIIVEPGQAFPGNGDVILIPGSKATLADLAFLRAQGWDVDIAAHARRGGLVVGLCGGYQMLGRWVRDPEGIEGPPAEADGLGLLDVETIIAGAKTLRRTQGIEAGSGHAVSGYEMHVGVTGGADTDRPWLILEGERTEGALSADGRIMGAYLHGIFAADGFRHGFLSRIASGRSQGAAYEARVEATLEGLANHLETHMNLDRVLEITGS
jgi:adenosylcobyric acid synthase